MLELKTFVAGLITLQKAYIGWQFDVKDEMQVRIWYTPFRNLTEEQYRWLIKEYRAHNDQPPKSSKNLTDILVNVYYNRAKVKPEIALNVVRSIISEKGGWEYGGKAEIFKRLAKYPALLETVKEFEDTLKTMQANDTYTADRFRKEYEGKLWKSAEKKVSKFLALPDAPGDKQALGSGTLPYEE